ncbi:DUF3137 domain-containing protein [Caminibacter sp.]
MLKNFSKIDISKINNLRKKELNRFFSLLFLLAVVEIAVYFLNKNIWQNGYVYIAQAVIGFFALGYIFSIRTNFKETFKELIFKTYQEDFGYEYNPDKFISESEFNLSGFFGDYDNYMGEDLIENDKYRFSYLNVTKEEEYEDSDGNTQTREVTVFEGYFYILKIEHSFKEPLLITKNSFHLSDILPIFVDKERVKLDYPEFEKYFDVYCDDKIEANKYLNHNRMQKMIDNIDFLKKIEKILIFKKILFTYINSSNVYSKVPFFFSVKEEEVFEVLLPILTAEKLYEIFK